MKAILSMFLVAIVVGLIGVPLPGNLIVKEARAIIGRPATPGSVAGVARRTTRRTVRRIAVGTRVAVLPGGCTAILRNGITYHHCGGAYYRPYYEGTKVVYVVVDNP